METTNDRGAAEVFLRAALWHGAGGNPSRAQELLAQEPALAAANLWCACVAGEVAAAEAFLAADPEAARRKGGDLGWEPLLVLCFSSFLEEEARRGEGERFVQIARRLLELGADANAFFTGSEEWGSARETALYGASGIANHPGLTALLLRHGADPADGDPENGGSETIYHTAEFADLRCMKLLFAHGIPQKAKDYCLYRQLDFEAPEGTRLFLENGANPNGKPGPLGGALHHALRRGRSETVLRLLLEAGADPQIADPEGITPYRLAARLGREEACAALASFGGKEGLTPVDRFLGACAREDAAGAARCLEENPGLVEGLSAAERAPFLIAVQQNRTGAARLLLEAGFDANGEDPAMRPLHWAAWFGHGEMVELLLHYRPDLEARNQYGGTPLGVAVYASRHCGESNSVESNGHAFTTTGREQRYVRVVRALLAAGARAEPGMLGSGLPAVEAALREALG